MLGDVDRISLHTDATQGRLNLCRARCDRLGGIRDRAGLRPRLRIRRVEDEPCRCRVGRTRTQMNEWGNSEAKHDEANDQPPVLPDDAPECFL